MVKVTKLGHKGSPFGELIFQDCRVPAENLVGEENALVRVVVSGLHRERIIWSAEAVGIAQGAYDIARKYSKECIDRLAPLEMIHREPYAMGFRT